MPGSADHRDMFLNQTWMAEDLNDYDLNHVATRHPKMTDDQWREVYDHAWDQYYSDEHVDTIMSRAFSKGISAGKLMFLLVWFYGGLRHEGLHPLEVGYMRKRYRKDRRPGMAQELPVWFHLKWLGSTLLKHALIVKYYWRWGRIRARLKSDPNARNYMDTAMTPPSDDDIDNLDMLNKTAGSQEAIARANKAKERRQAVSAE